MWVALILGCLLSIVVAEIHFESFNLISSFIPRLHYRLRILVVFFAVFMAHLIEISIYAFAFYLFRDHFGLGGFSEKFDGTVIDYLNYSAVSYTTVGLSAFKAEGPMKIITCLESLTGFMLITWSASFAYSSIGSFWNQDES